MMNSSILYLIRHAQPEPDSTAPASGWRLSHAGRRAAKELAADLRESGIARLVSSFEPKAVETAQVLGSELGLPTAIAAGLHEHDRSNVGFLPSQERLDGFVKTLFKKPTDVVFGVESAEQALARFRAAVLRLVEATPEDCLGIVSHGTVISLLVSRANDLDGYAYWKELGLPGAVRVRLPDFRLEE